MAKQNRSILNPFSWFGGQEPSLEDKIETIINRRNSSVSSPTEGGTLVKDAKSLSVANILAQLKAKVLSALTGGSRGVYIKPEWDFRKVALAFSNESIFADLSS